MSEQIVTQIKQELERISSLEVSEQPEAYLQLQEKLQQVLDGKSWSE